jgi:hypothetical protein
MFTRKNVEVKKDGQCVILGILDPQSRLWRINLKESMKPEYKAEYNNAHDNSNQK